MSWTSHDKFMGWVHSYKINRNNTMMASDASVQVPFPAIVQNPNFKQVFKNWNRSDTGALLSMVLFGTLISYVRARKIPKLTGYFNHKF